MAKAVTRKAVVYCVRDDKLLVFRHLDYSWEAVGIQVPAGSIREGEAPADAALRELIEETGHSGFVVEAFLGTARYDLTPYRPEIQERSFFRARPTQDLPERWMSQEDHDGEQPPTRLECFWIPLAAAHVLQAGQGAMLWRLGVEGQSPEDRSDTRSES
jgi:8-oxo-dGTP pyrophosphatase MutT (NUDIX family)